MLLPLLLVTILIYILGSVALTRSDPLSPLGLYSVFFSLRFILRPLFLWLEVDSHYLSYLVADEPSSVLFVTSCLLFLFYISVTSGFLYFKPLSAWFHSVLPSFNRSISDLRLIVCTTALTAASVLSYLTLLFDVGSVAAVTLLAREGQIAGIQLYTMLAQVSVILSVCSLFYFWFQDVDFLKKIISVLLFLASISVVVLLGDRSGVLIPFIVFIILYHVLIKKISYITLTTLFVVVIIGLFATNVLRGSLLSDEQHIENLTISTLVPSSERLARDITSAANLNTYDHFSVLVSDDNLQYRGGVDFYRGLIGVIPRVVWGGKPEIINPGRWFNNEYVSSKPIGRPITTAGIWYANFGITGIIVGGIVTGIIFSSLHLFYLRAQSLWPALVYGATILFVLLPGVNSVTPIQVVKYLVPLFIMYYLTTYR